MVKANVDFNIVHPQSSKDGTPDKQLSIITLSKRLGQTNLGDHNAFLRTFMSIEGIDAINPIGVYSIQVIIANTFDYETVLAEIRAVLERATSAVIVAKNVPRLVTE
jgi:hypothetical protein